jgi:Protein of unknown function (DUF3761)
MGSRSRQFGDAWRKAGILTAAVGLVLASVGGFLTGLAAYPRLPGQPTSLSSTRTPASGWTVRTLSATTSEGRGTDVVLSPTGPWTVRLVGFDNSQVRSVVYWVRDSKHRWRSLERSEKDPFESQLNWWEGDNSGYEAVTAHVTMSSHKVVKDPGGWHWIDGLHSNPEGSTAVHLNADGSASATYTPALHASVIGRVEFWLMSGNGHWSDAGAATAAPDGSYSIGTLAGTQAAGWNASDAAVSVHVVWPNESEFVDPDQWVWSATFVAAPAPPTARAAPATAPPAPPKSAAPPPSKPAPPAPAPNDPYPQARAAGAAAVCADGTLSFSAHRSGTCSSHGGVHWWTGNLGPPGPGSH